MQPQERDIHYTRATVHLFEDRRHYYTGAILNDASRRRTRQEQHEFFPTQQAYRKEENKFNSTDTIVSEPKTFTKTESDAYTAREKERK